MGFWLPNPFIYPSTHPSFISPEGFLQPLIEIMPNSIQYNAAPSIGIFTQWLDARHIKRHPAVSMMRMSPHSSGFRVVSTASIPMGNVSLSPS